MRMKPMVGTNDECLATLNHEINDATRKSFIFMGNTLGNDLTPLPFLATLRKNMNVNDRCVVFCVSCWCWLLVLVVGCWLCWSASDMLFFSSPLLSSLLSSLSDFCLVSIVLHTHHENQRLSLTQRTMMQQVSPLPSFLMLFPLSTLLLVME